MKPQAEILIVYAFIIIAAAALSTLIPAPPPSQMTQEFAQPSSALLYVAYIAAAGVTLAIILRYKERLIRYKKLIERTAIGSIAAIVIYGIIVAPEFTFIVSLDMAILITTYVIVKKLLGGRRINPKAIFIPLQIGLILILSYEFTPLSVLIFLVALAVYDFIAVFVTKHMLTLAQNLANPLVLYQASELRTARPSEIDNKEIKSAKQKMQEGKTFAFMKRFGSYTFIEVRREGKLKERVRKAWKSGSIPIISTMALGGGDFMTAGAVVLTMYHISFTLGILYFAGAIIGLLITFAVSNKLQRPLPAIPLIAIGFAVSFIIQMML